jgi:aldehyde dehydrogenase (NAD+)
VRLRRHGAWGFDATRRRVETIANRSACSTDHALNFDAIPAWKARWLAFGNTVVMKSALTPALAHALRKSSMAFPKGVFNLISAAGDGRRFSSIRTSRAFHSPAARARRRSPRPRCRTTRASRNGRKNRSYPRRLRFDRECSARSTALFATGHVARSSRIIVTQGIHDKFIDALAARVKALKVGDALAADSQMGPLASQAQLDTTLSYVDVATKEGGRRVVGGEVLSLGTPGYYIAPALIADTRQDMRINCEEAAKQYAKLAAA